MDEKAALLESSSAGAEEGMKAVQETLSQKEAQLATLEKSHVELQTSSKTELQAAEAASKSAMAAVQAELEAIKASMEKLQTDSATEKAELNSVHAELVEQLKQEHQDAADALDSQLKAKNLSLSEALAKVEAYESEGDSSKASAAAQASALAEVQELNKQKEAQISAMEAKLEESMQQHTALTEHLKVETENVQSHVKRIAELEADAADKDSKLTSTMTAATSPPLSEAASRSSVILVVTH